MPVKIYVGNYPSSFTQDDVLNLFQDYEGVELVGFFKNKKKCYSFLHCINEHQLIEVVTNLNAIDVCGRNLIVRAADEGFQKQIQESILKYDVGNYHPRDTSGLNSSTSVYENNENGAYSESRSSQQSLSSQMTTSDYKNTSSKSYQKGAFNGPNFYDNGKRMTKQNESISNSYENHNYLSQFSESDYSQQQNNHTTDNSFGGCRGKGTNNYYQNLGESERKKSDLGINPQEAFSKLSKSKTDTSAHYKTIGERFESYKTSSVHNRQSPLNTSHQTANFREGYLSNSRNASEGSLETARADSMYNRKNSPVAGYQATNSREQYEAYDRNMSGRSLETVNSKSSFQNYENLSYISVMNFPLYLPTRNLYQLFSDFNPLKVLIVCNKPRADKTPTEAIICFENEKDATDAILTLDNTVYQGRVLLVTDAVDMSLVSELLSIM